MNSFLLETFSEYFRETKKDWKWALPALLLPAIGTVFTTYVPPLIFSQALSAFASEEVFALNDIAYFVGIVGGAWLFGEFLWRLAFHFLQIIETRVMERLYISAMHRLLQQDLGFFHDNFGGSLTKKVISYAREYESFMDAMAFYIFANVLPLFFVCFVLWNFSPWLVVILIGLLILTILITFPFIKRRQKIVSEREVLSNTLSGHIADTISNIDAVRAFSHSEFEEKLHEKHTKALMNKTLDSWKYHNFYVDGITSPLYVLTNMVGLFVAIIISRGEAVALTTVFVTFTYYANFTRVVWGFSHTYKRIENSLSTAAQFVEILHAAPTVTDIADPKPLTISKGAIEFDRVNFRYNDGASENLFSDFNLTIPSGKKIGLVGRSGSGKTTITRLLLRFVNIDSGAITIDGQDISKVSQNELRNAIAYVPQEPFLFHRTIMENIRYGRLDATDEEVFSAAEKAHVTSFVQQLPEGYNTMIGEHGIKLSGGQRQRIAIARAIIKNAPILVLDEATSALDSESEKYIQAALWDLMKGKTTIVVAHRLSTIQRMDKIIVLDNGEILEQGTHKKLVASGGAYAALWSHQSGGFLEI
jgi:ATP-binding cassette subfamily B protein